jgi:hypothetical protein
MMMCGLEQASTVCSFTGLAQRLLIDDGYDMEWNVNIVFDHDF